MSEPPMVLTCGVCGHQGEDGTTYNHDCYWVFRERGKMARELKGPAGGARGDATTQSPQSTGSPTPVVAEVRRAPIDVEDELEIERMRLAACTAAALGNTEESAAQRIPRESPYWSASYQDVCNTVDREMALRAELEALRTRLRGLEQQMRKDSQAHLDDAKRLSLRSAPNLAVGREEQLAQVHKWFADELARLLTTPEEPGT